MSFGDHHEVDAGAAPSRSKPATWQRFAALAALALLAAALLLMVEMARRDFPWGLVFLVALALALASAWYGLLGAGPARVVGFSIAALVLLAGVLLLVEYGGGFALGLAALVALAAALTAAREALRIRRDLPSSVAPRRPVLFFNPKSGGGKAEQFDVAEQARARGIEPVELAAGDDLEQLVRGAVAEGADGLAMAGGDGSQAIVAAIAAELDLPYACVPAGTRNHFALDLGVDRDDLIGALDAFVDGGERRVDLAEVNGRVFVNNVSMGLYAEAVQREGYREAKLRTILSTVPDVLGPDSDVPDLRWRGPAGHEHNSVAAILVSNNRYRLGQAVGSGTRPRIDDRLLGITVASAPTGRDGSSEALQRPWREWSQPEFEVLSDRPVPAGIDGEAVELEPPLRFRIMPGVLRVRIARHHPGASPSASVPEGVVAGLGALVRVVAGRHP